VLSVRAGLNPFEVYCAQVAAYRTAGLANRRIAELEGYGWAGYLDQIDAEDLIKVRVGVFGSGGPARDLAEQIRAAGFSCIPVTVTMGNGQETWQGANRALLETMRDCTRQVSYLIWEEAASWSEHSLKKATLIQVADRGLKFRPGVNALAASLKAQPEDRTAAASRELVTQLMTRAQAHLDALDALKVSPAADTRARIVAVRTLGALVEHYQRVLKALR
jgi:hypothetical protein